MLVTRPWGNYKILAENKDLNYLLKELVVNPGQAISKQFHSSRDEFWLVISGEGYLELEFPGELNQNNTKISRLIFENEHIYIPRRVIHRLTNNSQSPFVILETQVGVDISEEDIVRLEDKYGRL